MKKEASHGQSALTEFSGKRSSRKRVAAKDAPVNITAVTNKIALQLVKEKLFKSKKEALEAALGFFYIWYSNPGEFEKLNAKRNLAPPEAIRTVQDITSDILMGLPTKKEIKLESTPQETPQS